MPFHGGEITVIIPNLEDPLLFLNQQPILGVHCCIPEQARGFTERCPIASFKKGRQEKAPKEAWMPLSNQRIPLRCTGFTKQRSLPCELKVECPSIPLASQKDY